MNRTWTMPLVEFFWVSKLQCRRLWRHWRRWPSEKCRLKTRRANSFVEDCERLESRMVLSMSSLGLNSVTLNLGMKALSLPSPVLATLDRDISSASSHAVVSSLSDTFQPPASAQDGVARAVTPPEIRVLANVSANSATAREGQALEMPFLTLFLGVRGSVRQDVPNRSQRADVVTKVTTQTAVRILTDLMSDRVRTPTNIGAAAELPTVSAGTRALKEVVAIANINLPPVRFPVTVPTPSIDAPVGDNSDRPTIQPAIIPAVIPIAQAIPTNPTPPPNVLSGETIIPRSTPPEVAVVSAAANVTSPTALTLIDAQFAIDLPAELEDQTPSSFAPLVEPIIEPVSRAVVDDVLDRPWWKAFSDPKVWLAALIAIASALTFWRVKAHHRLPAHP